MALPLILARTFKQAHEFARDRLGLSHGHYRVVTAPGTIKAVRNTTLYLIPGWEKRPDRFSMIGAMKYTRNEIVDTADWDKEPAEAPAPVHFVGDGGMLHALADASEAIGVDTPEDVTCDTCIKILNTDGLPTQIGTINGTPVIEHESTESAQAATVAAGTDFFDNLAGGGVPDEPIQFTATCVDCGLTPHAEDCLEAVLEPEGWEPPESLTAEQVLRLAAGESGAEVAPMSEQTPTVASEQAEALAAEKPKAKRRSRCKDCTQLHYKGEPCPDVEG